MRRLTAVVLCALAVGGFGVQAAMADPDPTNNKNAVILTFTCGEDEVEVVTILQNAASAAQLVDGSGVLVLVHVTVVDTTTGEVLFTFGRPRVRPQPARNDDLHDDEPAVPERTSDHGGRLQAHLGH
jgi:hypothetical protein